MIEPITHEEFELVTVGQDRSELHSALQDLSPLTGIKLPCRWTHHGATSTKIGMCGGSNLTHGVARRRMPGAKFRTSCKGGTLYIFRLV